MSKIDEKLGEVIDKLTKLAETHGGQAADLAVGVARAEAFITVFIGVVVCVLAGVGFALCLKLFRQAIKEASKEKQEWSDDRIDVAFVFSILPGLACFIAFCTHLFGNVLNGWAWVGLWEPKVYLAKQIMRAAGL